MIREAVAKAAKAAKARDHVTLGGITFGPSPFTLVWLSAALFSPNSHNHKLLLGSYVYYLRAIYLSDYKRRSLVAFSLFKRKITIIFVAMAPPNDKFIPTLWSSVYFLAIGIAGVNSLYTSPAVYPSRKHSLVGEIRFLCLYAG